VSKPNHLSTSEAGRFSGNEVGTDLSPCVRYCPLMSSTEAPLQSAFGLRSGIAKAFLPDLLRSRSQVRILLGAFRLSALASQCRRFPNIGQGTTTGRPRPGLRPLGMARPPGVSSRRRSRGRVKCTSRAPGDRSAWVAVGVAGLRPGQSPTAHPPAGMWAGGRGFGALARVGRRSRSGDPTVWTRVGGTFVGCSNQPNSVCPSRRRLDGVARGG
jgi:hypothetical protein